MIHASNFENLQVICKRYGAKLVAVSKTKPVSDIIELHTSGQVDFGENKAQELREKQPECPDTIHWHMIGHLQRNKVKYIAPFVSLIHSVDSMRLLRKINEEAEREDRVIPCLLQMHIAEESTKFGLDEGELRGILESAEYKQMRYVDLQGLMGMATFTEDEKQVRREFRNVRKLFEAVKKDYFEDDSSFQELSMGMSGDYQIALEEGSTIVRVGSLIFGERQAH